MDYQTATLAACFARFCLLIIMDGKRRVCFGARPYQRPKSARRERARRGSRFARARNYARREPETGAQTAGAVTFIVAERSGGRVSSGITGVPGVGKSTLIDQLGSLLTSKGHRVAVLAVDPSSSRSGGAILGDKTRMARLAADANAFIRPSPSSGTLGGVARTTRETILVCEAAGFDIILVETVGVGQSEIAVAGMVDFFLVLMLAGGGDELQGIKKGVMELADMIAITKADGGNEGPARLAAGDYTAALHILTPPNATWKPPVITISAREERGLDELWDLVQRHRGALEAAGEFADKRRDQDVRWMHAMIEEQVRQMIFSNEAALSKIAELEREVRRGKTPPSVAADEIATLIVRRA